jgi:hypothetical protein
LEAGLMIIQTQGHISNPPINLRDEFIYRLKKLFRAKTIDAIKEREFYYSFQKNKCIFIHIPKTAGVSVATSLIGNRIGHLSALDYKVVFGKENFHSFFKFAFVRNPFTRLISAYEFMQNGGYGSVDDKITSVVKRYDNLDDFVMKYLTPGTAKAIRHFRPQHFFICNSRGNLMIDYLGRFEELEKDYDCIRQRIGAGEPLKKLNITKSTKLLLKDYYSNKEVLKRVVSIYKKDFTLFGYSTEI